MPVIYTASEPGGPNGPIMDELLAAAPNAKYVGRKGEVSAWDNADFVKAVEATGRKTLVMAGVWTSVCVAFPALQAKADGYKVYAVMDASGDVSAMASEAAQLRMADAGVVPVTTNTNTQRIAPHLEPSGCCEVGRPVCGAGAELPCGGRKLLEGPGSRQGAGEVTPASVKRGVLHE